MTETSYLQKNKASWEARTAVHVDSAFYDRKGFLQGKNVLNSIELELLGDVKGKKVLHLQCHFGMDTLSLARMGAEVTGIDFSERAVEEAQKLANDAGLDGRFICCDLYSLPDHLNETFDIVFTSYGTIGWLPDIHRWAAIVARYLRPGGLFVFAEFHPVVWMFDNDFTHIQYRYFQSDAIVENETGTYTDRDAPIEQETLAWNHGLGEVVTALIRNGLIITHLEEFDYSPYPCLSHLKETQPGRWQVAHLYDRIPMVYALAAVRG